MNDADGAEQKRVMGPGWQKDTENQRFQAGTVSTLKQEIKKVYHRMSFSIFQLLMHQLLNYPQFSKLYASQIDSEANFVYRR